MKKHTKWIVAAAAGALTMTPVFAHAADDSDSSPQSAKESTSHDRAGNSPLSTEHSRNSMESMPPSYQVGSQPSDPATTRDRKQEGRQLSGTGSPADVGSTRVRDDGDSAANTGTGSTSDTATSRDATTARDAATTTGTAMSNAELLQKLHAGNQAEIQAGQWMQGVAQNDKVKDFAKKMVKDHTDMDKDVQKLAQKEGISLTTGTSSDPAAARDQQQMHMMQDMPPAQAERHYMSMMVNDHRRDVTEVRNAEQQAKSSNDKDMEKLLSSTAKKMENHLKDAQNIQRDLGSRQARTPSNQ